MLNGARLEVSKRWRRWMRTGSVRTRLRSAARTYGLEPMVEELPVIDSEDSGQDQEELPERAEDEASSVRLGAPREDA